MEHQSQSQAQAPSSSSVLAEDDVTKKNTDCVYFLASPLTCKKGSECEYRHSDLVRRNPRDCYYWLHGNCSNLKCGFRHPPLDAFHEKQAPTPTGPSPHVFQTNAAVPAYVPNATNKPGVPCIFFQKGYCLKGDWCPFLHGPNPLANKVSPMPEPALAFEPEPSTKALRGVGKFNQEKKVLNNVVTKPVKVTPHAKPSTESKQVTPKFESSVIKKTPQTSVLSDFRDQKTITSVHNGNPGVPQLRVLDERQSMNGKEAGEISREPSPGFDVLVDDEHRDPRYYPDEDQYEMSRGHESHKERAFLDHYPGDNRVSHERTSGGSSLERRPSARMHSRGEVDELDLRHRLMNPKRSNGLSSVISHERDRDTRVEDRRLPRRVVQHLSRYENSVSNRLRGRIRLPERSSSPIDRGMVWSSTRGRLSPERPNLSFQPGKTHDRIKGVVEEIVSNVGKNRRDVTYDHSVDFAAPKRLSELKIKKSNEGSGEHVTDKQLLGKRKHLILEDNKTSGNGASFEGPKPLQEILKRKRGEIIGTVSGGKSSSNEDTVEVDNNKNVGQDSVNQNEENIVQSEDNIPAKDEAGQEYEAYEQEGGYDYEQVADEELDLYDVDENGDIEGEAFQVEEEDDDDDFAKKMGVEFS